MTALTWGMLAALAVVAISIYLGWQWRRAKNQEERAWKRIHDLKDRMEQLAAENERLSRFLQGVAQADVAALFLIDKDRTILWLNQAARRLCVEGVQTPITLTRALQSYEVLELAERALNSHDHLDRQYMRDGRIFYVQALQALDAPEETSSRSSPLVVLLVRDVTEVQRLGRAQREFVANISHDLRTPITTIQLMAETLQSEGADNPKRRAQLLAGIVEQTAALQQLAQEVLDLDLIESGRMPLRLIEMPVGELIEPVLQSAYAQVEAKDLNVQNNCDLNLVILAAPDAGRRVVQNLLHNAIKFTPNGGTITIGAAAEGEDVRFWVQDTGVGIPPDELERIFERFFKADRTRGESGTGLGLAIAQHIVQGHGGRIWAESRPGQGAIFFFTLPKP